MQQNLSFWYLLLPQCLLSELGQNKRRLMQLLRVVLEQFILFVTAQSPRRLPYVAVAVFAAHHEAHLAAGICWNSRPGVVGDWEDALALLFQGLDDVHVEPWVLA